MSDQLVKFMLGTGHVRGVLVRLDGAVAEYRPDDPTCGLPDGVRRLILAVRSDYGYLLSPESAPGL